MNLMSNSAQSTLDVILKYNIRRSFMYKTRLKKVGGSIMLAVPPAVLKALELSTDSEVGMTIDNGCLIIERNCLCGAMRYKEECILPWQWSPRRMAHNNYVRNRCRDEAVHQR